jgi:hypothetical protein
MNKSRHAITDIEFLSRPKIEPRNQIIYLYQKFSGVLRFKVRDRVKEFAESIGCRPEGLVSSEKYVFPDGSVVSSLEHALFKTTLFEAFGEQPPFIITDLGDIARSPREKRDIDESLQLIAAGRCRNRALLMVSSAEGVSALDSWRDAIGACTYIEEPLITPENLSVALRELAPLV